MFENKEGYSSLRIGYEEGLYYTVYIPPVGYVENKFEENRLERRSVLFKDKKKADQYWRKTDLPLDYKKRRAEEKRKQGANPSFVDPDLQKFRDQEFDRIINGCWIMVDGEAVYLTGLYYRYLSWNQLDFGFPDFRFPDLHKFYKIEWSVENPRSYGVNMLGGRRGGKTATGGIFVRHEPSIKQHTYAGIQSKDAESAKKVFQQNVTDPWRRDPDFLRPKYNFDSKQSKKLEFKVPIGTGKRAMEDEEFEDEGLSSWINYEDSGLFEYDGHKLHRYYCDEPGKTEKVNVKSRWDKVKYCLRNNGKIIGKALFTTTIDDIGNNANPFFDLLEDSMPNKLKDNGETISGLHVYFVPADCTRLFDKYGRALREESRKEILAERSGITDQASLLDVIRKDPLTFEEAKMVAAKGNPFNVSVLNTAYNNLLKMAEPPYVVGNFVWDIPYEKARFDPDPLGGKWHVSWFPPAEKQNKVRKGYGEEGYKPDNEFSIFIGVDPISEGATAESARKSSYAMSVFRTASDVDVERSETFIADYIYRPDNPDEAYEDNLIACWFYGCYAHIEKNKFDVNNYFVRNNCKNFVMKRPENTLTVDQKKNAENQGAGTAAGTDVINLWVSLMKKHISQHGHRLVLPRTIDQCKRFKPELRTFFDLVVSAGYAVTAADAPYRPKADPIDVSKIMEMRKMQRR
jgi:uncharacterized protein YaaR (DUF327 family)